MSTSPDLSPKPSAPGAVQPVPSQLEAALASCFPQAAGRIAVLSRGPSQSGPEAALILVEDHAFWTRSVGGELDGLIRRATALDRFEVRFVPPMFIAKTPTGDVDRAKTLEHWDKVEAARTRFHSPNRPTPSTEFLDRIAALFPGMPHDVPVGQLLDSLGRVSLRILCDKCGLAFDRRATFAELASGGPSSAAPKAPDVFSIVALMDAARLGYERPGAPNFMDSAFIARLETALGCRVRFEQVVAPPVPILASDIVFHDWFMPRDGDQSKYAPFAEIIGKLKNASLILIDDEDAFWLLEACVFPILSHRFENNPEADLITYRQQRYSQNHHLLPKQVICGGDIPLELVDPAIAQVSSYLRVPVLRIAFHEENRRYTHHWEHTDYRVDKDEENYYRNPPNAGAIQQAILAFIAGRRSEFRLSTAEASAEPIVNGPKHFCSFLLNRHAVDYIVSRFDSFCIAGLPCSAPYIVKRIAATGKKYFFADSMTPAREDYDCLLCTGFYGPPHRPKPYVEFMQVGLPAGRIHNADPLWTKWCPPLVACEPMDWFRFQCSGQAVPPVGNTFLNRARRRRLERRAA